MIFTVIVKGDGLAAGKLGAAVAKLRGGPMAWGCTSGGGISALTFAPLIDEMGSFMIDVTEMAEQEGVEVLGQGGFGVGPSFPPPGPPKSTP